MKLLSFQFSAAFLAAVLGIGSLASKAQDSPVAQQQHDAPLGAEASKNAANKKPRGLLADSFFWPASEKTVGTGARPGGNTALPGVAAQGDMTDFDKSPLPQQSVAPVVSPASLNASIQNEPVPTSVLNIPAPPIVEAPSPLLQPTSWLMNAPPEAQIQAQAPAPISSSVSCSCSDDSSCSSCDCCPDPLWCHRTGVFADLLYLRAGNVDYIYAVEQTGTGVTSSPTGPTGRVGFDGAPGYRLGGTYALSDCSSLQIGYAWYNADTGSSITANNPNVLIFQPGVPQIPTTGSSAITSSATAGIRFQLLELDYRGLLYGSCDCALNYFAGLRYANLKQTFHAVEDTGVPVGLRHVDTGTNFDGFGIGMGIDGMRRRPDTGILIYGRSSASFVSGEYKATYRETAQFAPNSIIGNNLTDYRVMSILSTELGLGWQSCCGRVRVTGGYQFNSWSNALTTAPYIHGVQNRRFDNLSEVLTFDGFVTRLQIQF